METITIIPSNERQGNILKALLEEMKVRFTIFSDEEEIEVSDAAIQSIKKGLKDVRNGKLITESEANKIFQDVINQMD
jgi:predicted transcriptional regulator